MKTVIFDLKNTSNIFFNIIEKKIKIIIDPKL